MGFLVSTARAAPDVSIAGFLSDIEKVLVKVRDAADVDDLPPLKNIQLRIATTLSKSADGSLKFRVIEAGADLSNESKQEINLELRPPQPADKSKVSVSILPLADAIIDAARDVKKAMSGDPPLHLGKLEASVEFTVKKEASGTLLFVGAKAGSEDSQKILITFGE
jgi:hypothetical protein